MLNPLLPSRPVDEPAAVKRGGEEQWVDLQLPLYRRMIPLLDIDADPDDVELGYFNVSGRDQQCGVSGDLGHR